MPKQTWKTLAPQLRLVWQLSLPAILTQITTIAMQYIDSAMVGALGAEIAAGARDAGMSRVQALYPAGDPDAEAVAAEILTGLAPGDTLLIKASRAMHLETVAEALLRGLMQGNL